MAKHDPCKGCQDRTTGDRVHDCHTTCERYAAQRAACIKKNKARREYALVRTASMEGMQRMKDNPPPGPKRQR